MKKLPALNTQISEYFQLLYGDEFVEHYFDYINSDISTTIRVNSLKSSAKELAEILKRDYSLDAVPVQGIPEAFRVADADNRLGKTIEHITGQYYIQSLSSMLPPLVLNPLPNETVLDLCAAPGSKTTFLSALMKNTGVLIANEIQADRVKMLAYNLDRTGTINTGVVHERGEWLAHYYDEYFDKALVDAPCSGLGIMQKKGEVNTWWNKNLVERLSGLQYKLLVSALRMLKQGGELVYSTCTLTAEENEQLIDTLIKKYPVEILPLEIPVITSPALESYQSVTFNANLSKTVRLFPWHNDSEGFYIARLRKTGSIEKKYDFLEKDAGTRIPFLKNTRNVSEYLYNIFGIQPSVFEQLKLYTKSDDVYCLPADWDNIHRVKFNRLGIKLGEFDRFGNFILHTNGAQLLEKYITNNIIELDNDDEAKRYLEGGIIKSSRFSGRGQVVVKYKGRIIGTGGLTEGQIKSRYPRAYRTQAIDLNRY